MLARDERRSTARSSGMLSFGLLDVLAVVLFASTMQPYATTLMFALLLAKVVVGYRILRS